MDDHGQNRKDLKVRVAIVNILTDEHDHNEVSLVGRLGRDPVLRRYKSGKCI